MSRDYELLLSRTQKLKKKKLYIFFRRRCGDPTQMPRGPARFGVQTYWGKKPIYLVVHKHIYLYTRYV